MLPAKVSSALAIFDLDRTLLPGSSMLTLGRAMVDAGLVPRRRLVRAIAHDARYRRRGSTDGEVHRLRAEALAVITGLEQAPMVALARRVAGELVQRVTPGARLLLDRHLAGGDFCVILSASPQELLDAVAAELGGHRGIGTRAEVVDGRYTGRLDGPFCYEAGKLDRLAAALGNVDLRNAWAYADSASDLPLLDAVSRPVAVNPDRHLRTVALRRGWPILRVS